MHIMDADLDLVLRQYIVNLNIILSETSSRVNEKLMSITNEVNRCNSNLTILEKKIASISPNLEN